MNDAPPTDADRPPTPAEQLAAAKKPKAKGPLGEGPPAELVVWHCLLRDRRTALGLTMAEVAAACGFTKQTLFRYEYGTDPPLTAARRLAEFFGCSVEELWPARTAAKGAVA